jgi:DNA/RNA endonuclease YhcR with UshA esterase domain
MGAYKRKNWSGLGVSFLIISITFLFIFPSQAKDTIATTEAKNYIGTHQTVCGRVSNSKYASSVRGQPTFINLDKAYPNHIFTIVIWGENRKNFDFAPEDFYSGKYLCVMGKISIYRGKAQIEVKDPTQVESRQ